MEQHEQRTRFNLVGLRDAAEGLGEGGQVAGELRANAAVGKEGALLQEFLVHLVGGGCAQAEGLHECFRVQAAGAVESFRCGKRDTGFFVEVADHGIAHVGGLLFKAVEHHQKDNEYFNSHSFFFFLSLIAFSCSSVQKPEM